MIRILLDTNLLLRSIQPASPHHIPAKDSVDTLSQRGYMPCVSSQAAYEFLAVATRPLSENGLGRTHQEAENELTTLLAGTEMIFDSPALLGELRRLVLAYRVTGKKVHDARLAATVFTHSLGGILTFNAQDFTRYAGLIVLNPIDIANNLFPPALKMN